MKISNKRGVQQLIIGLLDFGITDVVLSPGSRNAPLSLSFENTGKFNVRVIPDERVAAYFALGISLQTHKPTVICCTSGTAVLNYAPAIAEAYYQSVPLIVITADRPEEWIDQGDGQTIRQTEVFKNYIKHSTTISGDETEENDLLQSWKKISHAFYVAKTFKAPVHINVPLEEPLYQLVDNVEPLIRTSHPLDTDQTEYEQAMIPLLKQECEMIWNQSKNILVLAGQNWVNENCNLDWDEFLKDERITIISENISNIHHPKIISCIDRTIDGFTDDDKEKFKPDILVTLGDIVVSKKVKAWLRKYKPTHHWKVGSQFPEMDTYRSCTLNLKVNTSLFVREFSKFTTDQKSKYQINWLNLNQHKKELHAQFISNAEWSDLKAFSKILDFIPSDSQLHLGNSSPIRYAQLFESRNDLEYFSNRGVSGIDGCTSTAAGMADSSGKCVTLISGDISFFYDSNAFWNDYLKNLKAIVINNGGGGIFRIIDQPEDIKDTEKLFETRHQRKVEGIANAFGIKYLAANDEFSLEKAVKQLYADNLPCILEIFTPTEKNPLILKNYFTFLKNK